MDLAGDGLDLEFTRIKSPLRLSSSSSVSFEIGTIFNLSISRSFKFLDKFLDITQLEVSFTFFDIDTLASEAVRLRPIIATTSLLESDNSLALDGDIVIVTSLAAVLLYIDFDQSNHISENRKNKNASFMRKKSKVIHITRLKKNKKNSLQRVLKQSHQVDQANKVFQAPFSPHPHRHFHYCHSLHLHGEDLKRPYSINFDPVLQVPFFYHHR